MGDTALEFRKVAKRYQQDGGAVLEALKDVSFALPAGRKVAITGRSGSGKSTLLNLAAGIDTPTEGEILVGGATSRASAKRAARSRAATASASCSSSSTCCRT